MHCNSREVEMYHFYNCADADNKISIMKVNDHVHEKDICYNSIDVIRIEISLTLHLRGIPMKNNQSLDIPCISHGYRSVP